MFIKKLLSRIITWGVKFEKSFKINQLLSNGNLSVGAETYGIYNLCIHNYQGSEAKVCIGKYCSLAPNIEIITGGIHPINWLSTYPFRIKFDMEGKYEDGMPYSKGDVVIGNDVWIGTGVTILSGVQIGDGAVIAAKTIVTKSIPPYAIVGGNPGKIIKYRFEQKVIDELLKLKWWHWNKDKIKDNVKYLNDPNKENLSYLTQ